jgi:hypothetical protein
VNWKTSIQYNVTRKNKKLYSHFYILQYTEQFKKKVTLSDVYNEITSEPTITWYTIVRKTLKVCNWRGKVFRTAAAGYRTPFAVESPFCNTVSPGGGGPKHFPASITNKLWESSQQLLYIAWFLAHWLLHYKHLKVLPSFRIALYIVVKHFNDFSYVFCWQLQCWKCATGAERTSSSQMYADDN